jgi:cyclopropane fatty-acyl-phospholipid synthase-like methyltransferase
VPAALQPSARKIYHSVFRGGLRVEWWLRDRFERHPVDLAVPPARLRFRVGEDSRLAAFLEVGRLTADNLGTVLEKAGCPLTPGQAVLDFGCGCGRTLLWLVQRFPEVQWHGVDVDAEAIAWCRAHFRGAEFETGQPLPALPYADETLDLVYAVSVFTHLNEDFQRAWAAELKRILKPGGMLLLSVYGEHVWRSQPEASAVEEGGFVFRASSKLKGILPDWYQTALQNRTRITTLLGSHFTRVSCQERALGDHDAVLAWK